MKQRVKITWWKRRTDFKQFKQRKEAVNEITERGRNCSTFMSNVLTSNLLPLLNNSRRYFPVKCQITAKMLRRFELCKSGKKTTETSETGTQISRLRFDLWRALSSSNTQPNLRKNNAIRHLERPYLAQTSDALLTGTRDGVVAR